MTARILLIEDSRVQAERLRLLLTRHGYEVSVAHDGEKGLAAAHEKAPDLVLTDVVMPGIDGLEVTRRMKADVRLSHIPVVVLTGSSEPADVLRVLDAGADNFVAKPYEDQPLVTRLQRTLAAGTTTEATASGRVPAHAKQLFLSALEDADAARRKADEANRVKDDFLATVSHELRTPLNAIAGWATMLRTESLPEERRRHAFEVISRNADIQTRLIEDLLEVSRISTGQLRLTADPVNVRAVVDAAVESVDPFATSRGVQIRTTVKDEPTVLGDAARLQQVLWNLLNNAVKFSAGKASVDVTLERADNGVRIEVRDYGRGIAKEQLPHLFERFRQAHERRPGEPGLGLGLAIAAQLVERHGGRLVAGSDGPGTGAAFTVWLPETRSTKDDPSGEHDRLDGVTVLLVDDELDMRELAAFMLRSAGARVDAVASADEALELLGPDHHVVVSDLSMPERTGLDLVRAIRGRPASNGGRVAAIALTALSLGRHREDALAAGFDGYLTKPIDASELVRVVRLLVSGPRAST